MSTLNRWEGFAHRLLQPMAKVLADKIRYSDVIYLDDTPITVRSPGAGTIAGHIRIFCGTHIDEDMVLSDAAEHVAFLYAPTWAAAHPEAFLEGSAAPLVGDAYRGCERIADANRGDRVGRLLSGCAMHARRPFEQALDLKDPAAENFIRHFQEICRVEQKAKEERITAAERLKRRKEESLPLMQAMRSEARRLQSLSLSKPMQQGVAYLLNQWDKLIVSFEADGRLEIDNGLAECRLRRAAMGRKAWLFAGAMSGAERLADLFGVVSGCDAAGVAPGEYIDSALPYINDGPNQKLGALTPTRWRTYRETDGADPPTMTSPAS